MVQLDRYLKVKQTTITDIVSRFKYRVVNYSKVYYACGRCDGTGTKTGDMEYGPYAISKTLKVITPEEHDPKQKVEEVRIADL